MLPPRCLRGAGCAPSSSRAFSDSRFALRWRRDGGFAIPPGAYAACMTSDFFCPRRTARRGGVECTPRAAGRLLPSSPSAYRAWGNACRRTGARAENVKSASRAKPAPRRGAHGGVFAPAHPQSLRHLRAAAGKVTFLSGLTRASAKWWPAANPARTRGKCATSALPCGNSACALQGFRLAGLQTGANFVMMAAAH